MSLPGFDAGPQHAAASSPLLANLNEEQLAAVTLPAGNALILAGAYDRYIADLARVAHHEGRLKPLDVARLAYIERVQGRSETARRMTLDLDGVDPESLPWTHRSLYTYQLVELKLTAGEVEEAARLAITLLPRIRRQLSLETNHSRLREEAPTRGDID